MSLPRASFVIYRDMQEKLETKAQAIAEAFKHEDLNGFGDKGFRYVSFDTEDSKFTIHFEKRFHHDSEILYESMSWSIDQLLDKSVEEMVAIGKEQLVKDAKQKESEDRAQKAREENLAKARRKQQFDRLKKEFEGAL